MSQEVYSGLERCASTSAPDPAALDLAVRTSGNASLDMLGLLQDLYDLTGLEGVAVVHLNRADPVVHERAVVQGSRL